MAEDRLRCTRCGERGEKWVSHTLECIQETHRIASEEIGKIEREPATVGELLICAVEAAKEGGSPFGSMFGNSGLKMAQRILEARGLPTGAPTIEDVSPASSGSVEGAP